MMPQIMLIELIYHVVLWLNAFPTKSGVSTMLLPCKIAYRHKLDFAKHCKAQFGPYCKAHNEPTPTNMMVTCSTSAIFLSQMRNLQGTCKFFNMLTGEKDQATEADGIPHARIHHQEI
jgi:hypothetical protein